MVRIEFSNTPYDIGENIISHFVNGKADEVQVIYNEFINVGKQEVQLEKFLPLTYEVQDESHL